MAMATSDIKYKVVVGIDFGTTYSGYAYSFADSKETIHTNRNWSDRFGYQSFKTPTSVLLDDNDECVAFGFEAEDEYTDTTHDRKFKLFKNFKMVLHKIKEVSTKTAISSTTGEIRKAITIFIHAISKLKEHLLEELKYTQNSDPNPDTIRWVLTVPAIWTETSKKFMREAAEKSGLIARPDQLLIALEPEAASFYCKKQTFAKLDTALPLKNGIRYIVLDLGGGTNDMVCHEVILDNQVRELTIPSGGSHGGNQINKAFARFLKEHFGEEIIQNIENSHPNLWYEFNASFEKMKKKCKGDFNETMRIEIPKKVRKELRKAPGPGKYQMEFQGDELAIGSETIFELFSKTVDGIEKDLHDAIEQLDNKLDFIIMLGGFSQSHIVYSRITSKFQTEEGCKVLRPHEAQAAVMKGAVLFGHFQNDIISRISRRTYGFDCTMPFVKDIHDEKYKIQDIDGSIRCSKIFVPMVTIGDEIEVISKREQYYDLFRGQTVFTVSFYSLNREPRSDIEYVDSDDFEKLGKIRLRTSVSDSNAEREVVMGMSFGQTEILIDAYDITSKNGVDVAIDFFTDKSGEDESSGDGAESRAAVE